MFRNISDVCMPVNKHQMVLQYVLVMLIVVVFCTCVFICCVFCDLQTLSNVFPSR